MNGPITGTQRSPSHLHLHHQASYIHSSGSPVTTSSRRELLYESSSPGQEIGILPAPNSEPEKVKVPDHFSRSPNPGGL